MNDRGGPEQSGPAESGPDRDGTRSQAGRPRATNRWRSPLGVGLAVSAGVHLVAILLYSVSGAPDPTGVTVSPPDASESSAAGTRIVNIVAVAGDVVEPTDPVVEEQEEAPEDTPTVIVEPGPQRGPVDEDAERFRTAGEVLRPHAEDSVLLREVDPELARLTDSERAQLRMNWMVNEWNELQDAERRAAEEALDWTYTDDEGNRWGVSPGKLHLGGLTLPLPALGVTQGVDPAADRMRRDLAEIEDQAARGQVWENWQRRAAEIRKRKDRERAERLGGQRVDTTGVRR